MRLTVTNLLIALHLGLAGSWAHGQPAPESLLGIPLSFVEIGKRKSFGLNSIVMVPRAEDGGGFVRLVIDRDYLTKQFVQDLMKESKTSKDHPFFGNGIEAMLGKRELVLKIYPGVAIHLRDGMPSDPAYRTFTSSSIPIKVVEFEGKAFVTTSPKEVRSRANNVFLALFGKRGKEERVLNLQDGSTLIIGQPTSEDDFPPRFKPRIE